MICIIEIITQYNILWPRFDTNLRSMDQTCIPDQNATELLATGRRACTTTNGLSAKRISKLQKIQYTISNGHY